MGYARSVRRGEKRVGRGTRKSKKSKFRYEWRPKETPTKVRFYRGPYGYCDACNGYVICDSKTGEYKCRNTKYTDGQEDGRCGHKGVFEDLIPVAINYCAFIKGGGKARRGATVVCNCWQGRLEKPCNVCHHEDETGSSASTHYAHNIILLHNFHRIPEEKDGRKFTIKEPCEGKKCKYCKADDEKIREKVFGKKEFFNPGYGFSKQLMKWNRVIGNKCLNCSEGKIMFLEWMCPHCEHCLISVETTSLDEEEIDEFGQNEQRCPKCGEEDFPVERIECFEGEDDEPVPGCENPVRTSIFDVDVKIQRSERALQITEISKPKEPDDAIKGMMKDPLDFQFLVEISPDKQASLMNRKNAFGPEGTDGVAKKAGSIKYE